MGRPPPRFRPGLALGAEDLYIERDADDKLFGLLSRATCCHVLAPRQVGKSSLGVRITRRLREANLRTSTVDLSAIHVAGDDPIVQQESWYKSLARGIAGPLNLDEAVLAAWRPGAAGTPAEQFRAVLRDVIAKPGPVVIFLDEIDRTLSLPASIDRDDFFGLLRQVANERASSQIWRQLTFCVLGVAVLSDLSRDPRRTAFALVEGVELDDFSRPQLERFAPELEALDLRGQPAAWLDEIYRWTRGHPGMTQRLCFEIADSRPDGEAPAAVEAAVERTYLRSGLQKDAILLDTHRRFLKRHEELLGGHGTRMLALTKRLRQGEPIEFRPQEAAHQALRMSGMAAVRGGRLELRNEIFRRVFGDDWVREREGERLLSEDVARWKKWPDHLLRGPALAAALKWEAEQGEIDEDERQLIRASLAERERIASKERAEQARRLREQRKQLVVAIAAAFTFLALAGLASFGFWKARGSERAATLQAQEALFAAAPAQMTGGAQDAVAALEGFGTVRRLGGPPTVNAEVAINRAIDALRDGFALKHGAEVVVAAFSPDGTRVVTAGADRFVVPAGGAEAFDCASAPEGSATAEPKEGKEVEVSCASVRVWDASDGRELRVLRGNKGGNFSASFAPDGRHLVIAGWGDTARLWDPNDEREPVALRGHSKTVTRASFSRDGTRVVTASEDGTARLWNAASGRELATLRGHAKAVTGAAFSPDGTRLVTASDDGTARLWDVASGHELRALRGHDDVLTGATFSPDGARVLTAGNDGTARLWDAGSGGELATLRENSPWVRSATFSPDGSRVVTASEDGTARLWDAASGRELAALRGHLMRVRGVAFSPDGARLATTGDDGSTRLWDAASGRELATLRGHAKAVTGAAFSPDGTRLVTAGTDGAAYVWETTTRRELSVLRDPRGAVLDAAFSPERGRVVTAGADGVARVWDAASGYELVDLRAHWGDVRDAFFSAGGVRAVTVGADGAVRIRGAACGGEPFALRGHAGAVHHAAFSPDGTRVVIASEDGTVRVWDAAHGHELANLPNHLAPVTNAAFSPDGTRIVTAGADGTARVWDAAQGRELVSLRGYSGPVTGAAFSPEGARVVTASDDGTTRVRRISDERELLLLRGHEGAVLGVTFSPDGTRIVTAGADGTARVWDAAQGRELVSLRGHARAVVRASFSPDGSLVVTVGEDGSARVWDLSLEHTVARGCSILRKTPVWGERPPLREACQGYLTPDGRPLLR